MTVPIVVSTSPVDSATDVDVASFIKFIFNTPILRTSVNEATVLLYRDDTGEALEGRVTLDTSGLVITFEPSKILLQETLYAAAVIGSADGMPGGNIKSADTSSDLVNTRQITFRTRVERYARLTEVTDRSLQVRVGPIQEAEAAETVESLEIIMTSPRGFASNVSRDLSEIVVTFSENVLQTGSEDALQLIIQNVLGQDEYFGEGDPATIANPTGRFLQDWLSLSDERQALFDTEVSGYLVFEDNQVKWVRYGSSPEFHYNSEVIVTVKASCIVSPTGHVMAEDVVFTFTTEYWPLYVGVEYIRLKLGSIISSWFDDTIRRHIHEASIDAVDQAAAQFDLEHPYPAVRRYVRSKVIVDILGELGLANALGSGRKRLGDLDIQYSPTDLSKVAALYKKAEEELKHALFELRYYRGQTAPRWFVKGSTFPLERGDYRMRTWQGLRTSDSPGANTMYERQTKSWLGFDHPTIGGRVVYLGFDGDERVEGVTFPWWES